MDSDNQTFAEVGHFGGKSQSGKDQLHCLFKATYLFDAEGNLAQLENQEPVLLEDTYLGEAGQSTLLEAADLSLCRPTTEIAVVGAVYPAAGERARGLFRLSCGAVNLEIAAFGERRWQQRMGLPSLSDPEPFEKVALHYENAFGGVDQRHDDPKKQGYEARNPIGKGFLLAHTKVAFSEVPVPQLEDPKKLLKTPFDKPEPRCSAFVPPHWEPRVSKAGTYDQNWSETRKPLLPEDFDPRFCNAVPDNQCFAEFAAGDETIELQGLQPADLNKGACTLTLPGLQPICEITYQGKPNVPVPLQLEKILIRGEARRLVLLWSGIFDEFASFREIKGTAWRL
ncbi:DUF2169 family type VI secretion system accessory protein [Acanthopleuribacter pedis]|uniref:DUF2169 domain-containing protein n=1 Tax=Acanthopleuribacter pedis TaxID=442870 RepID=A0A8J7QDI0_9BACT|nr:DUF2169 domain-containing protein [Acanthopleuribacter pedis]MBO1317078.1 DUF2169 domain-containing protein [Acanthopleuribacter pedis]